MEQIKIPLKKPRVKELENSPIAEVSHDIRSSKREGWLQEPSKYHMYLPLTINHQLKYQYMVQKNAMAALSNLGFNVEYTQIVHNNTVTPTGDDFNSFYQCANPQTVNIYNQKVMNSLASHPHSQCTCDNQQVSYLFTKIITF